MADEASSSPPLVNRVRLQRGLSSRRPAPRCSRRTAPCSVRPQAPHFAPGGSLPSPQPPSRHVRAAGGLSMPSKRRTPCLVVPAVSLLASLVLLVWSPPAHARVTKITILSRGPLCTGTPPTCPSFGSAGQYEV